MTNKKSLIEQLNIAQNIAICSAPNEMSLAVSIAFALFIKERFNKDAYLVYVGDIAEIEPHYSEFWPIKDSLSNKTVKIAIDYNDTDVSAIEWERASDSKFILNLKSVNKGFDVNRISTEIVGVDFDTILTVGISDLLAIDDFYKKNQIDLDASKIVNIDNSADNKDFGYINLVDKDADSLASWALRKFAQWNYTPSAKISEVLLMAMRQNVKPVSEDDTPPEENSDSDVDTKVSFETKN